jgi:hypothetical protein
MAKRRRRPARQAPDKPAPGDSQSPRLPLFRSISGTAGPVQTVCKRMPSPRGGPAAALQRHCHDRAGCNADLVALDRPRTVHCPDFRAGFGSGSAINASRVDLCARRRWRGEAARRDALAALGGQGR